MDVSEQTEHWKEHMYNTSWHSQKYDFEYILQFPQKERKMVIWQQKVNRNKSDWKKKKTKYHLSQVVQIWGSIL